MLAMKRLQKELISLREYHEFSCSPVKNNLFEWDIIIFGPEETFYEGGIFKAKILIPKSYPNKPPVFKFHSKITHPNIYLDGKVCISILNEGDDIFGYEDSSERWNPQHGISSVLLSIVSILGEPNFESPANVDASVLWRDNLSEMKKIIYDEVRETQK